MIESQVSHFLKFLFGEKKKVHSGAWFHGDGVPLQGYGSVHFDLRTDRLRETFNKLSTEYPDSNPGLHVCINNTDLKGRRIENIRTCNALVLDIDREIQKDEVRALADKYGCHLIVESSPRKYHFYWRLSNSVPLDRWSNYQLALAEKFEGDFQLRVITSTIRVPGFPRMTKSGELFTPEIVYSRDESEWVPIPEGDLVRRWGKWLPQAIKAGEKRLDEMRAEMAAEARRLWKARKKKVGAQGLLNTVRVAGRNVVLYGVVKDLVVKSDMSGPEIAVAAEGFNREFETPLDQREFNSVVSSALKRGLKVREKWAARDQSLLETNKEVSDTPQETGEKDGKGDSRLNKKSKKNRYAIPESHQHAARQFALKVYRHDKKAVKGLLIATVRSKNYQTFAQWFVHAWTGGPGNVGAGVFTKDGARVFLKTESKWGDPVNYATIVGKDQFVGMVGTFINELWRLIKPKRKIPTQSTMDSIGQTVWRVSQLQKPTQRQNIDVIAFQNGVLDFSSKPKGLNWSFEPDADMPFKASHTLWASFCENTAAEYAFVFEEVKNGAIAPTDAVRTLLTKCCPRFGTYLEDWFPEDPYTVVSLLRWFGYCFTTNYSERKFGFFYGNTAAGKGSLCRILAALVGENNYASIDYHTLDGGFNFFNLHDKLVVIIDEVEATQREHAKRMSVIKKLTGGERATFERKHVQSFEDYVISKFVLVSNEAPKFQDKGDAIRARMLCYGFEQSFQGQKQGISPSDQVLGRAAETEAHAIATLSALFWADVYCLLRSGARNNPFVVQGSRALKVGNDEVIQNLNIIQFICETYCEPSDDQKDYVTMEVMNTVIKEIAEEKGIALEFRSDGTMRDLYSKLEVYLPYARFEKNIGRRKGKGGVRGFKGIKLKMDLILKEYPELTIDTPSTTYL